MVEAPIASTIGLYQTFHPLHLRSNMENNFWCSNKDSFSNQKEQNGRCVYNYAERKSDNEKTPMCRVAELARYNKVFFLIKQKFLKLKHEYILLDESGPAHKKRFTVRLVLCPGEEFEGSGASIKKAQQAAAEIAIQKTMLPRPPQRSKKVKKDPSNPITLLKAVAARLSIQVHYHDESVIQPMPSHSHNLPNPMSMPRSPSGVYPPNNFGHLPPFVRNPFYQNGAISHGSLPPIPPFNLPNPFMPGIPPINPKSFHNQSNTKVANKNMAIPPINAQLPFQINMRMGPPPPSLPYMPFPPTSAPYQAPSYTPHTKTTSIYKFTVKLSDGTQHMGTGRHRQEAKSNAATQALFHLKPALIELENKISQEKPLSEKKLDSSDQKEDKEKMSDAIELLQTSETSDDECEHDETGETDHADSNDEEDKPTTSENNGQKETKRKKIKSVVSQVHECALRMKMNVEFEILMESGEPHNRKYLMRCKLSSTTQSIVADGEGPSKKSAKQDACKKLLEKVKGIENDPLYLASIIAKSAKKNVFTNAKDVKRKTIVKDMKLDPQYGQHINPISRLIQVMQIRKEQEPVFRLIGEHGQNRSREFTVEVTCQGIRKEGTGPNKKLAKRAAAEAMLAEIGYVKPMPQPGKSLLKKKNLANGDQNAAQANPVMEIGVFNPNEVSFGSVETPKEETPDEALTGRINALSLETFADVENEFNDGTHSEKTSEEAPKSTENKEEGEIQPIRSTKRRVTFSNEVAACPPDDSSQAPVIAPLKSEVVLVNKLKKRGKDSKKYLSNDERRLIGTLCRLFLSYTFAEERKAGLVPSEEKYYTLDFLMHLPMIDSTSLAIKSAKDCLEKLAKTYKFTVVYSDFPKAQDPDAQYFSLVTLGFEKPIVCHGCGKSEDAAHLEAAFNAIKSLSKLDIEVQVSVVGESSL